MQTQSPDTDPIRAAGVAAVSAELQPFIEAAEALERGAVTNFDIGRDDVAGVAAHQALLLRLFASTVECAR